MSSCSANLLHYKSFPDEGRERRGVFIQPSQPKGKQAQPWAKQAEVSFSDLQEGIRGQAKINSSTRGWRNKSPEDDGISEIMLTYEDKIK